MIYDVPQETTWLRLMRKVEKTLKISHSDTGREFDGHGVLVIKSCYQQIRDIGWPRGPDLSINASPVGLHFLTIDLHVNVLRKSDINLWKRKHGPDRVRSAVYHCFYGGFLELTRNVVFDSDLEMKLIFGGFSSRGLSGQAYIS